MLPIILDTNKMKIIAVGNGLATLRRMDIFDELKAEVILFANDPFDALRELVGDKLIERLPELADFVGAKFVFIADFGFAETKRLADMAHECGALVNAEDKTELCDFHVPAIVRRGDLLLTVSTNAKSPRIARLLRQKLEKDFGEEWADLLEVVGEKREEWKAEGDGIEELVQKTDELLEQYSWFQNDISDCQYMSVFSSTLKNMNDESYIEMSHKILEEVKSVKGFIGMDSARNADGRSVTVEYWENLGAIEEWKNNELHLEAKRLGVEKWFKDYYIKIFKIKELYSKDWREVG